VGDRREALARGRGPDEPAARRARVVERAAGRRDHLRGLRLVDELVRAPGEAEEGQPRSRRWCRASRTRSPRSLRSRTGR
jgi:hypothetical protein